MHRAAGGGGRQLRKRGGRVEGSRAVGAQERHATAAGADRVPFGPPAAAAAAAAAPDHDDVLARVGDRLHVDDVERQPRGAQVGREVRRGKAVVGVR